MIIKKEVVQAADIKLTSEVEVAMMKQAMKFAKEYVELTKPFNDPCPWMEDKDLAKAERKFLKFINKVEHSL